MSLLSLHNKWNKKEITWSNILRLVLPSYITLNAKKLDHYICVHSSFWMNISDEETFDLPSMSWIPTLCYSTYNLEISQHVHDVIYVYDSMWTFWVVANLCRFVLFVYICWRYHLRVYLNHATLGCPNPGSGFPTPYELVLIV